MVLSGPVATLSAHSAPLKYHRLFGSLMKALYAWRCKGSSASKRLLISYPTLQHSSFEVSFSLSRIPFAGFHAVVLGFLSDETMGGLLCPGRATTLGFLTLGTGTSPVRNSGLLLSLSSCSMPSGSFNRIKASSSSSRRLPIFDATSIKKHGLSVSKEP